MKINPSDAESVGTEIANFIAARGFRTERGNPQEYFGKLLGHVSAGLTLPIVPADKLRTVVLLKCYSVLWNSLIDDEMDRHPGTRHELDASMRLLLQHSRKEPVSALESPAAQVLQEMLSHLPMDAGLEAQRQLFYFDLWEMMNGFSFEYTINKVPWAANVVEYGKYSTETASIKHFLDLDCLFSGQTLPPDTYRHLRTGYEHFGLAIKFASDVGSLQRELVDEDNLNLIRLLARDWKWESADPRLKLEHKLASNAEFEALLPTLNPLLTEAHKRAKVCLDSGAEELSQVRALGHLDPDDFMKSVRRVFDNYIERDPFFKKAK